MPEFTTEQTKIIQAKHGNILVSAAAGSGKTTVMVERIVKRVLEGKTDIRRLLVLTFTDAAAANMKAKITLRLQEALKRAGGKERLHLASQLLYLPYARISTIHSFCLSIVREHAYLLDPSVDSVQPPDADFRVADQAQSDEVFHRAVDAVLKEAYERLEDLDAERQESEESEETVDSAYSRDEHEQAEAFIRLLDSYAGSKSDDRIRKTIQEIYAFLRSMPNYKSWVHKQLTEVQLAARDFNRSQAAAKLRRRLKRTIEEHEAGIFELESLIKDPDTELKSTKSKAGIVENEVLKDSILLAVEAIHELAKLLDEDDALPFELIAGQLQKVTFPQLRRVKNNEKRNAVIDIIRFELSNITGFYQAEKEAVRGTLPAYGRELSAIQDDLSAMLPVLNSLFHLVDRTDQRYSELKNELAIVDFNDFEHLALALLQKAEIADLYRNEIQEVYVDEFQDTSSIQSTIIEAVSFKNTFAVGDIKQSIYRFRHARPEIFSTKMERYGKDRDSGDLFVMSQNFRSVFGILDAVNGIFRRVMEKRTGEIDYNDEHALTAFHDNHALVPNPVEVVILDKSFTGSHDEEDGSQDPETGPSEYSSIENEGRVLADIILREKYGMGNRVAPEFKDITVLCMTHAHAQAISSTLKRFGLPVQGEEDDGYLVSNELRLMEALLQLLANEQQDIALLTCLRQMPVFGQFTNGELLEIKAASLRNNRGLSPYEHYHLAVTDYREHGDDINLRNRLQRFHNWVTDLRGAAVYLSLSELISRIYQDSALLEAVLTEDAGDKRVDNLRLFQKWAADFEARGARGIAYFVDYLEEKRKQGTDRSPFEALDSVENSIRILTFHRSKGLEFPLVFLVGLDRRLINRGGQGGSLIELSESEGIAFQIRRPDRLLAYPSILSMAMQEEQNDAAFAESMRLLYVAMTRAESKLYLLASLNRGLNNKKPENSSYQKWLSMMAEKSIALASEDTSGGHFVRADLLRVNRYYELILMSQIAADSNLYDFFSNAESGSSHVSGSWRHTIIDSASSWPFAPPAGLLDKPIPDSGLSVKTVPVHVSEKQFEDIYRSYRTVYPYLNATSLPRKFSVSEIKRHMQIEAYQLTEDEPTSDVIHGSGQLFSPGTVSGINTELNDWLKEDEVEEDRQYSQFSGAQIGTVLHTALRFLDLGKLINGSYPEIEAAVRQLEEQGVFSPVELDMLLPYMAQIQAFFHSPLAKQIGEAERSGSTVYREIPFTLSETLDVFKEQTIGEGAAEAEDTILIQGIIDLWYSRDQDTILIDFKSDHLHGTAEERRATLEERYGLQLELYSRAIHAATGKTVTERLIWSIPDACIYKIHAMN